MSSRAWPATADPGLQPERTTLAWSRTLLALMVASAVGLRWLPHYGPGVLALPLVALVAAIALQLTARRRHRRGVLGIHGERVEPALRPVAGLTAVCVALAVVGLVLVVAD